MRLSYIRPHFVFLEVLMEIQNKINKPDRTVLVGIVTQKETQENTYPIFHRLGI